MTAPVAWDSPDLVWDGDLPTETHPSTTMSNDNRISITISAAQKQAIVDAIAALHTALTEPVDVLTNLTAEERRTLPKIGDKSLAFDQKCADYMAQNPEMVPNFVDSAETGKDRTLVSDLVPCLRDLAPLCEGLEDTVTLAYSDLYLADLAFYQSVKVAAKRGVAGADTIYNDLKVRFPGRSGGSPVPPNP